MSQQEPPKSRGAATARNLKRTAFIDNSATYLQIITGVLILVVIGVLINIGQTQPNAWLGIAFGLAMFFYAVLTPRLRLDVAEGGVDLYEILWWETTVHRLTADGPAPGIEIPISAPGDEVAYYYLELPLPAGRKLKLRPKRALHAASERNLRLQERPK